MAQGLTNRQIAPRLFISPHTVDTHVRRLRDKLGSASRYLDTVRGVGYRFVDK